MPWDLDADVQVTEADMYFLSAYHNMTVYYYKHENMMEGKSFLLEINPYFTYREQDDSLNVIDARWIDIETGLYIDITAARYSLDHEQGEGILYDKNGHEYRVSTLSSIYLLKYLRRELMVLHRIHMCFPCGKRRSRASRLAYLFDTKSC